MESQKPHVLPVQARVMDENGLSNVIIGAAIEVHKALGPGLLESAYETCLAHELTLRSVAYERQKAIPVHYKGIALDCSFRIDLLAANLVVVELKDVEEIIPLHEAQILTYLRLTGCRLGLLLNFNVPHMKEGIRRFALNL